MENLIQLRLQSSPIWLKRNSGITPPLIPSRIPSIIHEKKLRTKQLHAKRKGSGAAVYVSEKKRTAKEKQPTENAEPKVDPIDDDEIPQPVFDRMVQRISISVTVPIVSGLTMNFVLDKLSKANIWEGPSWLSVLILLVSFGSGALAMAYGTLSTSWDPDIEGSFFGLEQIEKNWPVLWKEEIEKKKLEKKKKM